MIVFDGIAGSGKTTIISAVKEWFKKEGANVFDLAEWTLEHVDPPTAQDIEPYDVLFTFEPTKQWVGRAIRYEMSQTESPYSGTALAHAFSLDRLVHYRRLLIPARAAGKIVIQDRSVSSSIVYQPIMPDSPALEDLLALPGNELALQHAPGALILTEIDTDILHERMKRNDDSKGVFEDVEFLKKVQERFHSPWFKELFEARGTKIETIRTDVPIEEMKQTAINYVQTHLRR